MLTVICCHCSAPLSIVNGCWFLRCPQCGKNPALSLPLDEDEDEPDSDPTGDYVPVEPTEGE